MLECARREFLEETGIPLSGIRQVSATAMSASSRQTDQACTIFKGTAAPMEEWAKQKLDETEILNIILIPPKVFWDIVVKGGLPHYVETELCAVAAMALVCPPG